MAEERGESEKGEVASLNLAMNFDDDVDEMVDDEG